MTAAVWLPWLVFGIPAGVLVDRWDRRRTMLVGLGVRAVILGGLGTLAALDLLGTWVLVAFAFAYGVTEVFTDLAAQAQVPALVGRDAVDLRGANSKLLAVESVANGFAGPPLAGVLMALGAAWVTGAPRWWWLPRSSCSRSGCAAASSRVAPSRRSAPPSPLSCARASRRCGDTRCCAPC
nr:MFS transporter [Tessaracoccus coleopterorum]